jgi:hypothetical protein
VGIPGERRWAGGDRLRRRQSLWTTWLAIVGTVAHVALIASLSIRSSGFLSLEGAGIIIVPATLFAWILGVAVVFTATVPEGRISSAS